MPRPLNECYRIVASAIDACSLPSASVEPADFGRRLGESFDDLGFDSLAFMEFCIAIHVETGIELTVTAVGEMGSPAAVAKRLSEFE
jgi:hypothetical protein